MISILPSDTKIFSNFFTPNEYRFKVFIEISKLSHAIIRWRQIFTLTLNKFSLSNITKEKKEVIRQIE